MPAQAGIQNQRIIWAPAFAGVTIAGFFRTSSNVDAAASIRSDHRPAGRPMASNPSLPRLANPSRADFAAEVLMADVLILTHIDYCPPAHLAQVLQVRGCSRMESSEGRFHLHAGHWIVSLDIASVRFCGQR